MNNVANLLCHKKRLHSAEGEGQLSQPSCTDNDVNLGFNNSCSNSQLFSNSDLTVAIINCQGITAKKASFNHFVSEH